MNQHPSRRAALAAAFVGVLLAVTASVGLVLSPTDATASAGAALSGTTHVAVAAAVSQVEPSALGTTHPASTRTAGLDRSSGGHGYAVAASVLLVLSMLALVAAAATTRRRPASLMRTASGPRAPPALAAC